MVAPRVHLGQAHVGSGPAREIPRKLHVVAQVERVGREGEVTADRHEGEQERVGQYPDRHHPAGAQGGERARSDQAAQGQEPHHQEEEVLGPPHPVLAPAGPQEQGQAEARHGERGRDGEPAGDDHG
jgi:hypothetical protein